MTDLMSYGRQDIFVYYIHALVYMLKAVYLTQKTAVPTFEKLGNDYCNVLLD